MNNDNLRESIETFKDELIYNSFCDKIRIGGNKCNGINNDNLNHNPGIQEFIDSFSSYFINNEIINISNIISPVIDKLNNKLLSRISILKHVFHFRKQMFN